MTSLNFSMRRTGLAGALACGALLSLIGLGASAQSTPPSSRPAARLPQALQAPLLGLACAGARRVAVGEHGVVLLSDDEGRQWRQARQVPLDATLTGVSFINEGQGWAVGHRGAVLHTEDGGETWTRQRQDDAEDRPLFAVHFFNAKEGVAVGLWSLVLRTEDGGQSWVAQTRGVPKSSGRADLNLYHLFVDNQGRLLATAERGTVLRSGDQGRTWEALQTGSAASLWAGTALPSGRLLVGGLRGSLLRSDDDGKTWAPIGPGNKESVTAIARSANGRTVIAVGADGTVLRSRDAGLDFTLTRRPDRLALTGAGQCGATAQTWTLLGPAGPLSERVEP